MRSQAIISVAAVCGTAAFVWSLVRTPAPPTYFGPPGWRLASAWPHEAVSLARYVERHPTALGAWNELARRREALGDKEGAVAAWKRVVDLAFTESGRDASDPTLPFLMAWASDRSGDPSTAQVGYRDAAKRYESALARAPSDAGSWRDLGWCRRKLGDAAGAAEAWTKAAQLQNSPTPEDLGSGGLYNLACFRALAGDSEGALEMLGRAADSGWNDWQWALADEDLVSLHNDPRFGTTIAAMRSKWESAARDLPRHTRMAPNGAMVIDPH